jgi:2,4-dienoyl-CoA reductase-like NADH-dependent reductase (Old Yellow Enzyme family)
LHLQGLWTDSQIAPLKRIVDFCHSQGTKIGVQLAHAGRKASTYAPWVHSDPTRKHVADTYTASEEENGWPNNTYAPSAVPHSDKYPMPKEMTEQDMQYVEDAFVAATERAKAAGFDFVQYHYSHGYMYAPLSSINGRVLTPTRMHSFLSVLSNFRTDAYGGSLENRMRFPLRVCTAVRRDSPCATEAFFTSCSRCARPGETAL